MQNTALVTNASLEDVAAYLPSNYTAEQVGPYVRITGEDEAGWTMQDYVLPRLASALIVATTKDRLIDHARDLWAEVRHKVRTDTPALEDYRQAFYATAKACAVIGYPPPTEDDIDLGLEEWNGKRPHAKGLFKPVKRARGDMGDLMAFWYRWHSGSSSASLFGVMMRRSKISDSWDSLMLVAKQLQSGTTKGSNSNRWAEALTGRVTP